MEGYLESVQALFQEQPDDYDEETALLFLHRCNYDAALALSLLQPGSSAAADPPSSSSHSPPPTNAPHSPLSTPSSPSTPDADTDDVCSICLDGGHLIICERRGCHRVYHCECAGLRAVPQGRWECPRHSCSACGEDWEEDGEVARRRNRRRGERGPVPAGDSQPISHASRISTHSHAMLLSPSASTASSDDASTSPFPTPHVECSACPTAYCLPHVPPSVLTAYGIPPTSLTLPSLQSAVERSAVGVLLCASCMQVQERRERLAMLRRLSEALGTEGKGGERLWGGWEELTSSVGEEGERDFTRLLHHPTQWKLIEGLLKASDGTDQQQQGIGKGRGGKPGEEGRDVATASTHSSDKPKMDVD